MTLPEVIFVTELVLVPGLPYSAGIPIRFFDGNHDRGSAFASVQASNNSKYSDREQLGCDERDRDILRVVVLQATSKIERQIGIISSTRVLHYIINTKNT